MHGSHDDFTLNVIARSTEAANNDAATGTQGIQVTVNSINDIPIAVDDFYTLNEDESLDELSGVLTNDTDSDGDSLTAELVTGPVGGQVVLRADGTFTYTPDPDFTGTDRFTYQARDG